MYFSKSRFRSKKHNEGFIVVLVALCLIIIMAALGVAIDGGNLFHQRRLMQNAADAGAFAGATVLGAGNTNDSAVMTAITTYAGYNYVSDTSNNVQAFYADSSNTRLRAISPNSNGNPPSNAIAVQVYTQRTVNTYFLGILKINNFTASAMAACKAIGSGNGGGGYAIFAKKANMANGSKVIDWTGGSWNVTGNVHSNSDVNVSGTGEIINGMIEDVTGASPTGLTGKATLTPSTNNPVQSTVMADPVNKTLADFYQGTTSSTYYHYVDMGGNGTTNLSSFVTNGVMAPGVYYVNGNVNFATSLSTTVASNVTIVATGYEVFSTPSMDFTPYSQGVTFFANASDSTAPGKIALNVSGSNGSWRGILYAPNSGMNMSGSSNTSLNGSLVANTVKLSGSSLGITYDSSYFPGTGQPEIILYQ